MQIKEKTLQGKKSFLVDRHLSRKRAIKMLTGPLARRWCKITQDLLYMGRYAKRKPGLNKGQDCCPCITLHIPLFLYVQLGVYKLPLKIKFWVLHQCLAPPCHSFLILPFQDELPSGAWRLAMFTYLPWLLRPTREGTQGGAPSAIQAGAGGLRRQCKFLHLELYCFPRKPSYSASFLH